MPAVDTGARWYTGGGGMMAGDQQGLRRRDQIVSVRLEDIVQGGKNLHGIVVQFEKIHGIYGEYRSHARLVMKSSPSLRTFPNLFVQSFQIMNVETLSPDGRRYFILFLNGKSDA